MIASIQHDSTAHIDRSSPCACSLWCRIASRCSVVRDVCGLGNLLSLGGLASAQDRLDDLLLLDEEGAHNSLAHALGAAGAAISARHAALALLQRLQRMRADGGQLSTAKQKHESRNTTAHAAATNGEGQRQPVHARTTSDDRCGESRVAVTSMTLRRRSPCRECPTAAQDGNSIPIRCDGRQPLAAEGAGCCIALRWTLA